MDKDDKKEGLFKRLKKIEDKSWEQLQVIKDQEEKQLLKTKELKNIEKNETPKAIDEISKRMKKINYWLNLGK